ncbi:hypothetical protein EGN73_07775 [Arthrospiribacter ruber]|uniref:Cardiolipin synthase N-terminal domain-containing protein n=1 Tax=Arthrospiribacter ruber TaxID=2487934 RepID=A0A951IWV4_9BACT|nr:hypothetical protein [Arthrospiribacter ruber]
MMGMVLVLAVLYSLLTIWALLDLSKNTAIQRFDRMLLVAIVLFFHPFGPFLYFHFAKKLKRKTIFHRH